MGEGKRIVPRGSWGAVPPKPEIERQRYEGPLPKVIDHVVIHHTAFPADYPPNALQRYAQGSGWDDIAYHFYILGDGTIYQGRELRYVGGHAGESEEANLSHDITKDPDYGSIGIALAGNFSGETDYATEAQIRSLRWLIGSLRHDYPKIVRDHVVLHREVDREITKKRGYTPTRSQQTDCPGNGLARQIKKL
ncbi:MAG: N-acetylmuramoyl-L-alanine amidase [Deltaproteobacteria bacterium]|nr:N-acetylmuramoyl-L-alanine amidase [Deltaproteobacteria bacterium]